MLAVAYNLPALPPVCAGGNAGKFTIYLIYNLPARAEI